MKKVETNKTKTLYVSPELTIWGNYKESVNEKDYFTIGSTGPTSLIKKHREALNKELTFETNYNKFISDEISAECTEPLPEKHEEEEPTDFTMDLPIQEQSKNLTLEELLTFDLLEIYLAAKQNNVVEGMVYSEWCNNNFSRQYNGTRPTNIYEEAFDIKAYAPVHTLTGGHSSYKCSRNDIPTSPLVLRDLAGGDMESENQKENIKKWTDGHLDYMLTSTNASKFKGLNEFIESTKVSTTDDKIDFMYNEVFAKIPAVIAKNLFIINSINDMTPARNIPYVITNETMSLSDKLKYIKSHDCSHALSKDKPFMLYISPATNTFFPVKYTTFNISIAGFLDNIYPHIISDIDEYGKEVSDINLLKESMDVFENNIKAINKSIHMDDLDYNDNFMPMDKIISYFDSLRNSNVEIANGRTILRSYLEDVLKLPVLKMNFNINSFEPLKEFRAYNAKGILFVFDYFEGHVRVYGPEEDNDTKFHILSNTYVDIKFSESIISDVSKFIKALYVMEFRKFHNKEED